MPVAVYKPLVIAGSIAYVSGHGPLCADGSLIKGRVGEQLTLQEGKDAARQVGVKWYFIEDESSRSEQQIPQSLKYLEEVKLAR